MSDTRRLRRGVILHALNEQYPLALMRRALSRQVAPFYGRDEPRGFDRDVEYLREKGYLTAESRTVGGQEFTSYEITTAGIDLVDGSITDPGVEIAAR